VATDRPYRGVSADERREARRAAFVEAGLDEVGSGGWAALTLRSVCRRAGLTERYFYESFGGLDAFRAGLVDLVAAEVETAIAGALREVDDRAPADTIRAVVEAVWRTLIDDPRRGRVATMEGLTGGDWHDRRQAITARIGAVIGEEGAGLFGLPADHPLLPVVVAAFVGAADEILLRLLRGEVETSVDRCADVLVATFAHGVPAATLTGPARRPA
jgi:AcrR family transcriptional regulator